jgi:hypothetical protein
VLLSFHIKILEKSLAPQMLVLEATLYYDVRCSEIFGYFQIFAKWLFSSSSLGVGIFLISHGYSSGPGGHFHVKHLGPQFDLRPVEAPEGAS